MRAALLGIDWGTSNVRVMRIAAGGAVLDVRGDARGAGILNSEGFARVLAEVAGEWMDEGLPILACGMVGARGKWIEAPYLAAPATVADLAGALVSPEGRRDVRIVPGMKAMAGDRMIDVMRGEETQAMGLDLDSGDHRIVAPGTHSKWIATRAARIVGFRTFMTGELFAAIRRGTILGAGMGQPGQETGAFADGVARALDDPAVTALLFSVRVETLADRLGPNAAADYLSGLLIGAEIAAQRQDTASPVTLVGADALAGRYATALKVAGFSDIRAADGAVATARGLWRIHEAGL